MSDLNWGILGTAGIARKAMIPAIRAVPGNRIAAIASRSGEQAERTAAEFGIPKAVEGYDALIEDPGVDAIYIPLPNHLHVEMTLRALDAGKHVLCEKPMVLTRADAERIAAAARRSGRHVAEAFMTRHHPQWQRAKALVDEGRIGRPTALQILFAYHNRDPGNVRNQRDIGGGCLNDVGCYATDAAQFFFGTAPEQVFCAADLDPVFGTDRLTSGVMTFPEGRHLTFTVASQLALAHRMTLLGTEGVLTFDTPFNCPPDHAAVLTLDDGRDVVGGGAHAETLPPADQYARQVADFAAQVRDGAGNAALPTAIANASALEAMARAIETGAPQTIHLS